MEDLPFAVRRVSAGFGFGGVDGHSRVVGIFAQSLAKMVSDKAKSGRRIEPDDRGGTEQRVQRRQIALAPKILGDREFGLGCAWFP